MPLLVGDASSADRLEDVKLGAMPQAGAPAEDDLTLGGEGWLSEDARATLQNNVQRRCERSYAGTSLCLRRVSDAVL